MTEEIKVYIEKYSEEIQELYEKLRTLVLESVSEELTETMWAKLPSYYRGEKFVRLIPFKDHINIEACEILKYKEELKDYKLTPKGMLQIYLNQDIPDEILKKIFAETLIQ